MSDITLGQVEITRVEELYGPVGMTPAVFFPESPKHKWDEHRSVVVPDFLDEETDICRVAVQTWVLRSEGRTILIDTGVGNHKERPYAPFWGHLELDFLGNLARAGVQPDGVDIVINTHLHVDHVGWNTRLEGQSWVPTFRNASYLMPKADFEFWNPANNPKIAAWGQPERLRGQRRTGTRSRAGHALGIEPAHRRQSHSAGRARPHPGIERRDAGLRHRTRGLRGRPAASPFQIMHPEHNSCFCEDAHAARRTRGEMLGWAADTNALVLPAHFTGHGALEVERSGNSFGIKRWAPLDRL